MSISYLFASALYLTSLVVTTSITRLVSLKVLLVQRLLLARSLAPSLLVPYQTNGAVATRSCLLACGGSSAHLFKLPAMAELCSLLVAYSTV